MFGIRNRESITTARTITPSLRATFTKAEIASMAGLGTLVQFNSGADLITEGSEGTHVYFITVGSAAVRRGDTPITMLSPGDMVGERALVTGEPRNATVTALMALTAIQFDRQQFAWLRLESNKVKALTSQLVATRN